MTPSIVQIGGNDTKLWCKAGTDAYRGEQVTPDQILWPSINTIENGARSLYLLATVEDVPVGRLLVKGECLLDICVKEDFRRQGIGTRLVEHAETLLAGKQKQITLSIDYDHSATHRGHMFFNQLGFFRATTSSIQIDLALPFTDPFLRKAETARAEGVAITPLSGDLCDITRLAAQVERHFPGYPGFQDTPGFLAEIFRAGGIGSIARVAGNDVGFMLGMAGGSLKDGRVFRKDGEGVMLGAAVDPAHRRKGVASLLALELMKALKKSDNHSFLLSAVGMAKANMRYRSDPARKFGQSLSVLEEMWTPINKGFHLAKSLDLRAVRCEA